VSMLHNVQL